MSSLRSKVSWLRASARRRSACSPVPLAGGGADGELVLLVILGQRRPVEAAPTVERFVELGGRAGDLVVHPAVVPPGGLVPVAGPGATQVGKDPLRGALCPPGGVRVAEAVPEGRKQPQAGAVAVGLEQVGDGGVHRLVGLGEPDRVDVGADEVLVGQVEAGCDDRPGDHVAGAAEPVAVVGVAGGAVGEHQRRLAAAAGPAGALRVVGGGGRHVAQPDGVEVGDVDAELHRRRAVEQRQFPFPEGALAFEAVLLRDLRGVLAGQHAGVSGGQVAVQVAEERVDPGGLLALERFAQRVAGAVFARPGVPAQRSGVQAVVRAVGTVGRVSSPARVRVANRSSMTLLESAVLSFPGSPAASRRR